jgi:hypothetical protein
MLAAMEASAEGLKIQIPGLTSEFLGGITL